MAAQPQLRRLRVDVVPGRSPARVARAVERVAPARVDAHRLAVRQPRDEPEPQRVVAAARARPRLDAPARAAARALVDDAAADADAVESAPTAPSPKHEKKAFSFVAASYARPRSSSQPPPESSHQRAVALPVTVSSARMPDASTPT